MKIQYEKHIFRKEALAIIEVANGIIEEYQAQGYNLTLRQLYYQFVVRDILPNSDKSYEKLGGVINNGRLAGLVDWKAIIDRTREDRSNGHWSGPEGIIQVCAKSFMLDSRSTQDNYIEVWVEKDALIDIVEQISNELDVPCLSCRGYVSQSAMWQAAQRFQDKEINGKRTILIHLGDHDPSGIDMTRDIQDRLRRFETEVEVDRVALIMDQIDEYNPPPNPAKVSDSRYDSYMNLYGDESWELDALDPGVITNVIRENVAKYTNEEARQKVLDLQDKDREKLQYVAKNWKKLLKNKG